MVIPCYFVRAIYCCYNTDSNIVTMSCRPFYDGHLSERGLVGRKALQWTFTHDRARAFTWLARRLARISRSVGQGIVRAGTL